MDPIMVGAEPAYLPGNEAGVVLLHDLGSTPQALRPLADALAAVGVAVEVPLLPGHGTSVDELDETLWDDWASAAQLALDELASRSGSIVVVGLSMGAALGCWSALAHPSVVGVVAINPRAMPIPEEATEMLHAMLRDGCKYLTPLPPDISDKTAPVLAYNTVPVRTLLSMFGALGDMADHWSEVSVPMLIITSGRDHRVSPYNAEWLGERVGGPVERLVLERSFHEATLDIEHGDLETAVVTFVQKVTASAETGLV